ncbi:MAG: recombinase family protein [Rhizobiaceae bacterium]|nr:recombinase family protein [Rhizobiaceae bacterium]
MKKIRCAIYTRKSSEEGLEQEFNSLHAQREACVAYVASQKHEGWVLLPEHYDDGGISGGTLERPSLQRLMTDVEEGSVDQIVVYKIDRLTRSLADFAKLVEKLDAADASFVSVTQSFNTATSMGRLTLNVLLSFAQFEREVTAERIRDKIAASKKKGLWMGGGVPLGYEPDGRTLRIKEEGARTVRTLFKLYLKHRSLIETTREAERIGLRSKPRRRRCDTDASEDEATVPFCRSQIHYILTNPVYAGLIRHKDQNHEGQHPAIIDRAVWDNVQALLSSGAGRVRGTGASSPGPSLLAGKLFDEAGDRLTPSHASKKGRRYRYYVSCRMVTGKSAESRSQSAAGWRLPAKPLENQLAHAVIAHLRSRAPGTPLINAPVEDLKRIRETLDDLAAEASRVASTTILECVERATVAPGKIEVSLDQQRTAGLLRVEPVSIDPAALLFDTPFQFRKRGVESKLVIGDGQARQPDATLIRNIAEAHRYYHAIKSGASFEEIAETANLSKRRILQVIDLAFLAPDIVRSVVQADQPIGLTAKWLGQNPLPSDWEAQQRIISAL